MSDLKNPAGIDTFVCERTGVETAIIGLLAAEQFAWAQTALSDLNRYADYEDWLDSRQGLQIGLSMAGVDAQVATVELGRFLTWCRLSDVQPSEQALDAFAAMSSRLRSVSAALAYIRRDDFERYRETVTSFRKYGDYETWLRLRALARHKLSYRKAELPIHVGDFLDWCQCVGEGASEASLDRYATLLLEFLVQDIHS